MKIYETSNFGLIATLQYLRFPIININHQTEGSNPRTVCYFEFEDTTALQDAIKKYWNKDIAVEPVEFSNNVREIKAMLKSNYRSPSSDMNG